jgi:hypothetical protein
MDQTLSSLAVQLRALMTQVQNEWTFVNNGAAGSAVEVLTGIGYDNTDDTSPGGQTDAAYASYVLDTMNTLAQVYFGDATQASDFDFNNALAPLWGGVP